MSIKSKLNLESQDWSQYKPDKFEYNGKWIRNDFSNMIPYIIKTKDYVYRSVENFSQANKAGYDFILHNKIAVATPAESKYLGRRLKIDKDQWEDIKYDIMYEGLKKKWLNEPYRTQLLNLPTVIIEWNNWKDKIWGVTEDDSKGVNALGQLLMLIREEIKNGI